MAILRILLVFVLALALVRADEKPYTSRVLEGTVACLDCPRGSDLSGVQVLIKCEKVKKLAMVYTEEDGGFTAELPSDDGAATASNCMAKIMGGPQQLYIPTKHSITRIAYNGRSAEKEQYYYSTATALVFYKACPAAKGRCQGKDMGFASSKTVDFPIPREWGLAPSSYYVPFIPIIGIP